MSDTFDARPIAHKLYGPCAVFAANVGQPGSHSEYCDSLTDALQAAYTAGLSAMAGGAREAAFEEVRLLIMEVITGTNNPSQRDGAAKVMQALERLRPTRAIQEPPCCVCSGCGGTLIHDAPEPHACPAPSVAVAGTVPPTCGKTGPHVVNGVCPYCGYDPDLDEWSSHSEYECGSCGKGIMPVENDDGSWRFAGVYEDDGDEVFNPDGTRVRSGEAAGVPKPKEGE